MKPPQTPQQLSFSNPFAQGAPKKLKVFAPDGSTMESTSWVCIREHPDYCRLTELFLQHEDGTVEILSKNVVVKDIETGKVCYNPRTCPIFFGSTVFLTGSETHWLDKNPHWPAILELWDNPVNQDNMKNMEGLHPDIGNES